MQEAVQRSAITYNQAQRLQQRAYTAADGTAAQDPETAAQKPDLGQGFAIAVVLLTAAKRRTNPQKRLLRNATGRNLQIGAAAAFLAALPQVEKTLDDETGKDMPDTEFYATEFGEEQWAQRDERVNAQHEQVEACLEGIPEFMDAFKVEAGKDAADANTLFAIADDAITNASELEAVGI